MIRKILLFLFFLFVIVFSQAQTLQWSGDSTLTPPDSGINVISQEVKQKTFGLLDSVVNDSFLSRHFKAYENINNQIIITRSAKRDVPSIKEIKHKRAPVGGWQFLVVLFILFFIAMVKNGNYKNFRIFMNSVFNLKLTDRIWEEQRSYFNLITLELFTIYTLVAALFCNFLLDHYPLAVADLEFISFFMNGDPILRFFLIFGGILLLYLAKFILHSLVGSIIQVDKFGLGFISNTVTVNNFISLVIFPFLLFLMYAADPIFQDILIKTITVTFLLSVIFRIFRIIFLSNSFFTYPKFYLFIYLCTFEIAPWVVAIKLVIR